MFHRSLQNLNPGHADVSTTWANLVLATLLLIWTLQVSTVATSTAKENSRKLFVTLVFENGLVLYSFIYEKLRLDKVEVHHATF
jgi:hypothetical protein